MGRSNFKRRWEEFHQHKAEADMEATARHFTLQPIEIREDDKKRATISGYGAVFYRAGDPATEYELWSDTYERIMPGAFDGQASQDVRSLFNHDSNIVLGRTKSGTLRLSVDAIGLRYDVTPPDTAIVRDQVLEPIRRGDVNGSSFMFRVTSQAWITEQRSGKEVEVREIRGVKLIEVGPVTIPAYDGTSSGLRADDLVEARSSHDAYRASREAAEKQREAVNVRARKIELEISC